MQVSELLSASTIYDNHKLLMERASAFLELSERAYSNHLAYAERAEEEARVLRYQDWKRYPFVSHISQLKQVHKATIARMAAERCMKAYRRILFKLITEKKKLY
jgi:hypothetical protein